MGENVNYKNAPLSKVHKQIFWCYVLGQISCGYALGIAGTAVTQATEYLNLNSFWVGILGAGTLIGLMGSIVAGNLSDKIGRRNLFYIDMILFTILSLTQLFATNVGLLLVLRIGIGIMIAIDYTVGSALMTEWFPLKESARFQSFLVIFWTFGFVISYFVGLLIGGLEGREVWHFIFASSAVPGLITALLRLKLRIPESPSWLATVGRREEAIKLVKKYLGDQYTVFFDSKSEDVDKVSWKELFASKTRINTLVGGIFYACQVFPYFGIGIFLPILVENMNIGNSNISGILYNVFMIVGAILGVVIFNRISRRAFLLSTFYISAIALLLMVVGKTAPIAVTLVSFSIFAIVMSASVVLENPYPPELFNTRMRGSGVGAVIAISRIGAAAGTFLLPIIVEKSGVYVTLGVCMAVLLFGGIFCHIFAPETSPKFGKPVE